MIKLDGAEYKDPNQLVKDIDDGKINILNVVNIEVGASGQHTWTRLGYHHYHVTRMEAMYQAATTYQMGVSSDYLLNDFLPNILELNHQKDHTAISRALFSLEERLKTVHDPVAAAVKCGLLAYVTPEEGYGLDLNILGYKYDVIKYNAVAHAFFLNFGMQEYTNRQYNGSLLAILESLSGGLKQTVVPI